LNEKNIRIVFAGGGSDRSRLEKSIVDRGLTNVVMIPRQPQEHMPQLWSLCDVSLAHLKNVPLFKTVIPSKIFESMAMGLPIVMSVPEGEATELIRNTNCGLVVLPERPDKLSEVILRLAENVDLRQDLAGASLLAAKKFNRKKLALDMLGYVEKAVKTHKL